MNKAISKQEKIIRPVKKKVLWDSGQDGIFPLLPRHENIMHCMMHCARWPAGHWWWVWRDAQTH
jgi:hypothetical protein